jgi:hypothetical protein
MSQVELEEASKHVFHGFVVKQGISDKGFAVVSTFKVTGSIKAVETDQLISIHHHLYSATCGQEFKFQREYKIYAYVEPRNSEILSTNRCFKNTEIGHYPPFSEGAE